MALSDTAILLAIERLRRAQPRNSDTLLVCDELQVRIVAHRAATAPVGRPLEKHMKGTVEAMKPWVAEGMSRRTWYRRRNADAR